METISKAKITELLKKKLGFSALVCEEITNSIFAGILNLSLNRNKIVLPNFGKFQVYNKGKRPAMNLKTGMILEIKPRKVLRFNPAKSFKEKVNSNEFN